MLGIRSLSYVLLGTVLITSGCAAAKSVQSAAAQTIESMRPTSFDYADPSEEASDPWIVQAGAEARGDRPKEKAVEPKWFMDIVRSPKARDIENNLGFE